MKFKKPYMISEFGAATPKLQEMIYFVDNLCKLLFDIEITITSILRKPKPGRLSFHPIGQAFDIRVNNPHDGSPVFDDSQLMALETIFKDMRVRTRGLFDFSFHPELKNTPSAHIHVEEDSKSQGIMPI